MLEDINLTCEDCGASFIFSAGEQEFFSQKGLVNQPKRCPECRKNRKRKNQRKKEWHDATCSACGAATQVPFKPSEDKPVYCKECYQKQTEI